MPLIPKPNGKMELKTSCVKLPSILRFDLGGFPNQIAEVFAQRVGISLSAEEPAFLRVILRKELKTEEYCLCVASNDIKIEVSDERGLCCALTTLAALTKNGSVPCCNINDAPRFLHRGFMLDSARHFFPVSVVKKMIEMTSMVKLNVFHWHLTDDQGWRVESKLFPALHEQFSPEFYSHDDIREIVEYARLRGVEIIPEIDLPGHVTAILAVYPELSCSEARVAVDKSPGIRRMILCAGKERVFDFLSPLLTEIAELFPSRYIHLGGDEAPKTEWESCPNCRRRMDEEKINSFEELQGWFTSRLAEQLRALGKRVICWNESLVSGRLPEDITIQYWAETSGYGPTKHFLDEGGSVIFSDMLSTYLDLPYGTVTLKNAYNYEPILPEKKRVIQPALGIETCLWSEFVATEEKLKRQAFPRAYAIAEAAWTLPELKDYKDFRRRLGLWLQRYPGSYPLEKTNPGLIERSKERMAFLRNLIDSVDKESPNYAGLGKIHWRYKLRWLKHYFL